MPLSQPFACERKDSGERGLHHSLPLPATKLLSLPFPRWSCTSNPWAGFKKALSDGWRTKRFWRSPEFKRISKCSPFTLCNSRWMFLAFWFKRLLKWRERKREREKKKVGEKSRNSQDCICRRSVLIQKNKQYLHGRLSRAHLETTAVFSHCKLKQSLHDLHFVFQSTHRKGKFAGVN